MKYRHGFISNSSSSSFMLLTSSNRVITSPKKLINLLRKRFNSRILFIGKELNDGVDCFELDFQMKRLILWFSQIFIKNNPKIYAIVDDYELINADYGWDEDSTTYKDSPTYKSFSNKFKKFKEEKIYIDNESIYLEHYDEAESFIKRYMCSDSSVLSHCEYSSFYQENEFDSIPFILTYDEIIKGPNIFNYCQDKNSYLLVRSKLYDFTENKAYVFFKMKETLNKFKNIEPPEDLILLRNVKIIKGECEKTDLNKYINNIYAPVIVVDDTDEDVIEDILNLGNYDV